MLKQYVNPSVSLTTQLSILLKGKVSVPANPSSFSKSREGISLELAKFFAHSFAVVTSRKCTDPQSAAQLYARTMVAFRILFTSAWRTPLSQR